MKTFSLLTISLCLLSFSLFAQEATPREIGVRINSLNNFGMIYKKQLRENTYRRYRLAFGDLTANFRKGYNQFGFSVGGAVGREKRRPITDRLQFIYGTEFLTSLGINSVSSGSVTVDNGNGGTTTIYGNKVIAVTPSVGIGLVLGAQYNLNPRWYVSAELIPSVTASGTFGNGTSIIGIHAGFNSSSAGLTAAYRF